MRPVNQLSLEGEFIKYFPTIKEAAQTLDVCPTAIHKVVSGKQQKVNGFKFEYAPLAPKKPKKVYVKKTELTIKKPTITGRPVNEYSLEGKYLATYPTARLAGHSAGCYPSNIAMVCRKMSKYSGAKIWRYTDEHPAGVDLMPEELFFDCTRYTK